MLVYRLFREVPLHSLILYILRVSCCYNYVISSNVKEIKVLNNYISIVAKTFQLKTPAAGITSVSLVSIQPLLLGSCKYQKDGGDAGAGEKKKEPDKALTEVGGVCKMEDSPYRIMKVIISLFYPLS